MIAYKTRVNVQSIACLRTRRSSQRCKDDQKIMMTVASSPDTLDFHFVRNVTWKNMTRKWGVYSKVALWWGKCFCIYRKASVTDEWHVKSYYIFMFPSFSLNFSSSLTHIAINAVWRASSTGFGRMGSLQTFITIQMYLFILSFHECFVYDHNHEILDLFILWSVRKNINIK